MKRFALALLLPISMAIPTGSVDIKEWKVPFGGHPRDPWVDAAGRVWFVGQQGHYVGQLEDKDGTPWYTGNLVGHIGKVDPATGKITKYAMPDPAARDPHTLVFDKNGDMWFTVQGGNFVGHFVRKPGRLTC